ncbi:uncharacterized protein LOC108151486 [Drosophila miranda]|uniref:uncharacterized protein LOC108151486 n=1 Tax=Drosophila miranda TaxID=7229 RepID=UPI0007E88042|nr:uncharacterized protein LOC108151486 [Drosophila miranda]
MSNLMSQQDCDNIKKRLYNRVGPHPDFSDPTMAWPKSLANCPEMAKLSIKPEPITDGHGSGEHVIARRGQMLTIGLLLADQLAEPKKENPIWPSSAEVEKRLRSTGIYKNRLVAPTPVLAATTECAGDPGANDCRNWRATEDTFSN